MTGFSVYLGKPIDKDYIREMLSLGYRTIFTSLQIPEESDDNKILYFETLCDFLRDEEMTFIIDIHPRLLTQELYSYLENIKFGTFIIRVDDQLNKQLIHEIHQHNLFCCLNASTITKPMLEEIYADNQIHRLYYCHNYYPRPDTGLSIGFVNYQNQLIRRFDKYAKVFAFISGSEYRGPLYKGLPTVETHRHLHCLNAAQSLINSGIDDIIVGDTSISLSDAKKLSSMLNQSHFKLRLSTYLTEFSDQLFQVHTSRIDAPENVIRSKESRARNQLLIEQIDSNSPIRHKGTVTIDNYLNGRYQGELQIIKSSLPSHPHVNQIAQISDQDLDTLSLIQPGDTFEFIYEKGHVNE